MGFCTRFITIHSFQYSVSVLNYMETPASEVVIYFIYIDYLHSILSTRHCLVPAIIVMPICLVIFCAKFATAKKLFHPRTRRHFCAKHDVSLQTHAPTSFQYRTAGLSAVAKLLVN